jgi:tetratricopeptide (TPR) repeat protein
MIYTFKITNEYSKALDMVQTAIKINPDKANYYNTEAWIHYGLSDKKSTIEAQKKAVGLNPNPTYIKELATFEEM